MRFTKPLCWIATVTLAASATIAGFTASASAAPGEPAPPRTSLAPVLDYIGPVYNYLTYQGGVTKVMAVLNASTSNLAPLIQHTYTSASPDNDRIMLERESTAGVFRLKPQHTYSYDGNVFNDKCLAVQNNSPGNNIPIVNATCTYDSINNDVWLLSEFCDGIYCTNFIINQSTGKCITTQNGSTANNARLVTYTCNYQSNGLWYW